MRAINAGATRGFTLIEAMVTLAIVAILLAVGVPNMSNWLTTRKAMATAGFYQEGLTTARTQAITHNGFSRLVLINNANGQMDWRVDICYPVGNVTCTATSGSWSTETATAGEEPDKTNGYKSVLRSASTLPPKTMVAPAVTPQGSTGVYFTPLGWVDGRSTGNLTRIDLAPDSSRPNAFVKMRVALTLGGGVSICNPAAAASSPKRCP